MFGDILGGIGSMISGFFGQRQAQQNVNLQKEFAQTGIRMRVNDAKKAGIHPLYALGAQTSSFSPVSVGGDSFGNAGQQFGRAIDATSSHSQRQGALGERLVTAQLARTEAEIANINARTALINQQGSRPALPMPTDSGLMVLPGQGDSAVTRPADGDPLYTHDPRVALVSPPKANVQAIKSFDLPMLRNPKRFSAAQDFENEYGEEGPPGWIHNTGSYLDALGRAIIHDLRQKNPWLKYRTPLPKFWDYRGGR